jgi:hypothetical protein
MHQQPAVQHLAYVYEKPSTTLEVDQALVSDSLWQLGSRTINGTHSQQLSA